MRLKTNRKRAIELAIAKDTSFRCIAPGHYTYKNLLYVYVKERTVKVSLFSSHHTYFYRDLNPLALNELLDGYCKQVISELRDVSRSPYLVTERRTLLSGRCEQDAML